MSESIQRSSKEKRRWRNLGLLGMAVTAGSAVFLDKHEVREPQDAFFTVTRIADDDATMTHIDEIEIPVALAGVAGAALTVMAAGVLLEIRREQSQDDNQSDQL